MSVWRGRFGTAIGCIDGRAHAPLTAWLRATYDLDFIDLITEPGVDKLLAEGWPSDIYPLKAKAALSCRAHDSRLIAIAAHHDCAANPVSREEHWDQVRRGLAVVRSWLLPVEIIGLWVNEHGEIEVVAGPERAGDVGA